jgi:hypothetical protein
MNTAFQVLTELTLDPFHLDAFLRDPGPLCAEAGIALEDLQRFAHPAGSARDAAWSRCAMITDPGHDPLPEPDESPSPEQS